MKYDIKKLENIFTGDIVYCRDMQDTKDIGEITFLKVTKEKNDTRVYLVNKQAFKIIRDK